MKHPVRMILCLVLLALSGCAGSGLGFGPTPEPRVLRFAYIQEEVNYGPLLETFQQQNPTIRIEPIEVERFGGGGMERAVRYLDVDIYHDNRRALEDAQEGLLMPLGDLLDAQWSPIRDDYVQGTWEALMLQGQQWGVPAGMDIMISYLNKDHLAALNLAEPEIDWTLADFLTLAQKMNYPEGSPQVQAQRLFGFCTSPQAADPVVFVYLHGGRIVDDLNNPSRAIFDEPATIEAVQWYTDLFALYAVAPDPDMVRSSFGRGGIYQAATTGACAVWFQMYGSRGGLGGRSPWQNAYLMRPLPQDRSAYQLGDLSGYFVTKHCQYPAEAARFLRFLADHWEAAGQQLPPRRSLVQQEPYLRAIGKEAAALAQAFSGEVIIMPTEEQSNKLQQVGELFEAAVERTIREQIDPVEALLEAQDEARALFQNP